jgi:hypothetical protein
MRRGHKLITLAACLAATAFSTGAPGALADSTDICQQVRDGQINPSDPIVQGYCGPIVVVLPPPPTVTITTTTPAATPPAAPTSPPTVTPPTSPAVVAAGVKGAQHTAATPTTGVKNAQHTAKAPVAPAAIAPLATTKTTGTLPFTGAQLALFALVGLALLATGLLLRSTGRPSQRR